MKASALGMMGGQGDEHIAGIKVKSQNHHHRQHRYLHHNYSNRRSTFECLASPVPALNPTPDWPRLVSHLRFSPWALPTSPHTLPKGPKVVPFGGSYLEFYKVIPKRNYFGAYG